MSHGVKCFAPTIVTNDLLCGVFNRYEGWSWNMIIYFNKLNAIFFWSDEADSDLSLYQLHTLRIIPCWACGYSAMWRCCVGSRPDVQSFLHCLTNFFQESVHTSIKRGPCIVYSWWWTKEHHLVLLRESCSGTAVGSANTLFLHYQFE